ncbi:MAG: hypothetical protein O3B95_12020 [Chloroflexi bacterium]|nr:hypothetical protein [Chloroflexota bacterium]
MIRSITGESLGDVGTGAVFDGPTVTREVSPSVQIVSLVVLLIDGCTIEGLP